MKYIIQFIFSGLLTGSIMAQPQQQSTTIQLIIEDCRSGDTFNFMPDSVSFYNMPSGKEAFLMTRRYPKAFQPKINVEPGNYKIRYKNKFNLWITKEISITMQPVNTIQVCPDSLASYPQNTLGKMQENDSLIIHFQSSGCFHWYKEKFIIKKLNNGYLALVYDTVWKNERIKGKIKPVPVPRTKTATLSPAGIAAFIRFENELNFVYDGGCTTRDIYKIENKSGIVEKIDGSCRWRGYYHLQLAIFGREE